MIAAACGERGLGREASGRRVATTVAVEAAAPCPAAQRVRADGARPDPFPAAAAQCVWPGCAATAAKRHGATALVPALAQRRCNGGAATPVRRRGAFGLATLRWGGATSLVPRRRWSWPLSGCAAMTARWRGAFGRAALRRRRDGAARRRWSGPYPGARRVQPDGSATAARRRGATALVPAQIIASSYCHYSIGNINGSKYVIK